MSLTTGLRSNQAISITDMEFNNLSEYIKTHIGISLGPDKKYLIETRLGGRLKELNLRSFSEYFFHLKLKGGPAEKEYLATAMTTNETFFYRHTEQIKAWREGVLPERRAARQGRKVRVWSAGCSSGDEAGTLAIEARELMGPTAKASFEIIGTDIDKSILDKANAGIYAEYAIRHVPKPILDRYFRAEGGKWQLVDEIRSMTRFEQLNLKDSSALSRYRDMDVIFCRNVLIYFDEDLVKDIVRSFYESLVPGGFLIIGHTESLHRITRALEVVPKLGSGIYRRPIGGRGV